MGIAAASSPEASPVFGASEPYLLKTNKQKNLLTILFGFPIMHPDPTHLPAPSLPPSALATPSPNQNQT